MSAFTVFRALHAFQIKALDPLFLAPESKLVVHRTARPDAGGARAGELAPWLGEELADPRELRALLTPYPSEEMIGRASARVNSVKSNDPSLIELIAFAGY